MLKVLSTAAYYILRNTKFSDSDVPGVSDVSGSTFLLFGERISLEKFDLVYNIFQQYTNLSIIRFIFILHINTFIDFVFMQYFSAIHQPCYISICVLRDLV